MPGHKGSLDKKDITELPGADNLLCPSGIIARSQALAAQEAGAKAAHYCVNGSTAGVLAMLLTVPRGSKIIVGRDMHQSVFAGLALAGLIPVYIEVEFIPEMQAVKLADIKTAIEKHPDAAAIFLTYPNYYGKTFDIAAVKKLIPSNMRLLIDGAHAGLLIYGGNTGLPHSPVKYADLCTVSFHKTLSAKNQSAVIYQNDNSDVKSKLNMVQTSSPSYPILASIDEARAQMCENGEIRIAGLLSLISDFCAKLESVDGYRRTMNDDRTRLVIDVSGRGYSGFQVSDYLAGQRVFVEAADSKNIILICTLADTPTDFERFLNCLETLPQKPPKIVDLNFTLGCEYEFVPAETLELKPSPQIIGQICTKNVLCYPPGVPIILAGGRITARDMLLLETLENLGYNII